MGLFAEYFDAADGFNTQGILRPFREGDTSSLLNLDSTDLADDQIGLPLGDAHEHVAVLVGTPEEIRSALVAALDFLDSAVTLDAVELRDGDGDVAGYACPHCASENTLAEHDKGERWNSLYFDCVDADGAPVFGVKEADRDFDHVGYVCLSCTKAVGLPENTQISW